MTIRKDKFQKGGVELPFYEDSLERTMRGAEELTDEQLKSILDEYEQSIGEGQPRRTLELMVKSFIQNEWLLKVKGEIPEMTQKGHEIRSNKAAQPASASRKAANGKGAAKKAAAKAAKTPAAPRLKNAGVTFQLSDKADYDSLVASSRGQRKFVLEAFKRGKGDIAKIVERVEAAGLKTKGAGGLEASVNHHIGQLREEGVLVPVE